MNSLKRRLFFILVAATGLIWLAATCWVYFGTTREVENVLDSRLQEAARMVLSLASTNGTGSFQKDADASHPGDPLSYERQLSCQIWSLDGRLMARSSGTPSEKLSDTRTGFSERTIKGERWRVFTAEDPAKNVRVVVGDRLGLREAFVTDIIKGLAGPMLLTIPLLALLIWVSLNRGLGPIQILAEDLKRRDADDMTPLLTTGVPTEIQPMVASLNNLFGRVDHALRHERDITAFAAHELRTPLAGLRTQAQIAMTTTESGVRDAALRQILFSVDRTTRLVRQLLTIARLDSERGVPLTPVRLGEVVDEMLAALPAADREADVIIDPVLERTVATTSRDALLLAVRNLHENAVRHMPERGTIRWSSERTADGMVLFVEDTGPGIAEDELELVTNRFFRGRNKTAVGSGLGLSIVTLALRAGGAQLRLKSRSGGPGLRAEILWPSPSHAFASIGDEELRAYAPLSASNPLPA
ncbi:sensor histidine kinase N-terminal domain-containing protein [Bradyrhizobium sp. 139]|uniref:ATP-binding protein n=1 Tax=Bradyrhizobium sp. 139 TaxID=2782616 RepID=UPI001FF8B129|nr:ATP-binding protein [Bradyrhizobium sp. 139]MCK1741295.1 sensor histidine kinase N-terminal domain-containing protein [Bradyrhizobium sp. 139]